MANIKEEIIALEKKFWKHMTAGENEKCAGLLAEHSIAISDYDAQACTPEELLSWPTNILGRMTVGK